MNGREILVYLSVKYSGDFSKIFTAIKNKEQVDETDLKKTINSIKSNFITILDEEYPDSLKQISSPPFVLYFYGDISLLNSKTKRLAVIGSRDSSNYGEMMTRSIVNEVSKTKIIVSGLARGIDSIAHESCLKAKGKTIAVLGCGIDYIYPKENEFLFDSIKKEGLLISEYPNNIKPCPEYFPVRNRLIAGFSDKILVTEAYQNSGTNITVLYALKQGKDVMVVPYEAMKNSSCNKLIQDGAILVESAEDVLYNME